LAKHLLLNILQRQCTRYTAPPVNQSDVAVPSDMLAFGDGFSGNKELVLDVSGFLSRNVDWIGNRDQKHLNYGQISRWVHERHHERANMVFCDGHVQTQTLKYLFQDTDAGALAQWNRDHQPHREQL
ncbi:MAG TPA: hypothetical protein VFF11_05095, partial [Candidatus Binatia bacterium]|nr:hypothetical protein [Candidatus Binatia bacterium]